MTIMIDYKAGAKCTSVCAHCERSVPATLKNETLSLCEGEEEVENVLVDICDICGNITAIPARSLPPIHKAIKKLVKSEVVSEAGKVTIDLKSIVDKEKQYDTRPKPNYQHEYPMQAAE